MAKDKIGTKLFLYLPSMMTRPTRIYDNVSVIHIGILVLDAALGARLFGISFTKNIEYIYTYNM